MNKLCKLFFLANIILITYNTKAQTTVSRSLPVSVTSLIPKDYEVYSYTFGDLNRDTLEDLVIVLRCIRNEEISGTISNTARPLLIFIGQNNNTFKLVARADYVVVPVGYGIEFQKVTVKNGFFSIELRSGYEWWNARVTTFKYDDRCKNWFLYKDGGERFNCYKAQIEKRRDLTPKDFGKIPLEKYKWYEFHIEKYDPSTIQPIAGMMN